MRIFWHFQCLVKTERRLRARSGYEIFWIQLRLEQPHHDGGLPQPEHVRQGQRRPADFQHRRPAAHESQTAVELVVAASERWQSAGRSEQQAVTAGLRRIGVSPACCAEQILRQYWRQWRPPTETVRRL